MSKPAKRKKTQFYMLCYEIRGRRSSVDAKLWLHLSCDKSRTKGKWKWSLKPTGRKWRANQPRGRVSSVSYFSVMFELVV